MDFIFLQSRDWIEDREYPFLTLLGQSLGSLVLAFEALCKCRPDVFFGTPFFSLLFDSPRFSSIFFLFNL